MGLLDFCLFSSKCMSLAFIVQYGAWYLDGCKDFHCVFPVFYVFVSHVSVFTVMFFLCVAKFGWDREVVGCHLPGTRCLVCCKVFADYVVFSVFVFFSLYGVHLGVLQRLGGTGRVAVARWHVLFFSSVLVFFLVFVFLCSFWCVAKIGWDREGGGCQVAPDQEV